MERFPHLKFVEKITGQPRLKGGGKAGDQTTKNKSRRQDHAKDLRHSLSKIKTDWKQRVEESEEHQLFPLDPDIVPFFIQIDTNLIGSEFDFVKFGVELISEEDDGYIIGASLDNFRSLESKITDFIAEKHGSGRIAELWQIIEGNREGWKPRYILSERLYDKWGKIKEDEVYDLEVSIAFDHPLGAEPDPTKRGGEKKLAAYRQKQIERDDLLMGREEHFEQFVSYYNGEVHDIVHLSDSFGCAIKINGKGLKDLVYNYPFAFEVAEVETISISEGDDTALDEQDIEILPPDFGAAEIAVIDSGIMEQHKYLKPAIVANGSLSYLKDDKSTADWVEGGGHGTKVAGAILYPNGLETVSTPYQLPCFIRNIRILNRNNRLEHSFPAKLMEDIVKDNTSCGLFNLSITSSQPCRKYRRGR